MFAVTDFDSKHIKSYATRENAIKAVEAKFGGQNEGQRHFNLLVVRREDNRYTPVLCNITQDFFQTAIHSGFALVN